MMPTCAAATIIEAVFENMTSNTRSPKRQRATWRKTASGGSNTSTLPITQLAEASDRPENFIGIHFFAGG